MTGWKPDERTDMFFIFLAKIYECGEMLEAVYL
jgi:hypothetical protein